MPTTTTAEALPIHTVTARWGIDSTWEDRYGNTHRSQSEPDWQVLWVQPTGDPCFPFAVRVRYDAGPGMTNPCTWWVPDLDSARYDLSRAIALPRLA